MMTEGQIKKECLNGWWDIFPLDDNIAQEKMPEDGFFKSEYMVPSFFTKSLDGVRKKGEKYYRDCNKEREVLDKEDNEFLFDAYGYPVKWSKTRSAWIKREYILTEKKEDRRYFILFKAVEPMGIFFVNGIKTGENKHPTLPFEAEITDLLRKGSNTIAVLIKDYEKDDKGRTMVPSGNNIPCDHSGIWQDVFLLERGEVYIKDITITTSVRKEKVWVKYLVKNTSERRREILLTATVTDWHKEEFLSDIKCNVGMKSIIMEENQEMSVSLEASFKEAIWWEPDTPLLYTMNTTITAEGQVVEKHQERFGFREVWIDGKDIMLNDHPVHLFSDWGHKASPYHHTKEWIFKWYQMMKDGNMNHTRLHTHPHPEIYLEMADEMGILITGEAGLHGSGGMQASESKEYYMHAYDHISAFIKRDKNHPSLILWSVENEMRWNSLADKTGLMQEYLPKLRKHFNQLDPSRPAYHEGDSSLWNEKEQDIISRHYGRECAGIGWWDQKQPLHSGEMGLYHYAGPNNTCHLGGDLVYSSYEVTDKIAATDTAYLIEAGRTVGVSCFGPWNLSCLENLRMEEKDIALTYEDFSLPGVKPLLVPAHSSEFEFYKEGKGYTPFYSFDIQKEAFRPVAVIDLSLKSNYYEKQPFLRTLTVVNDSNKKVTGELSVLFRKDNKVEACQKKIISVGRGQTDTVIIEMMTPAVKKKSTWSYEISFYENDLLLDTWQREITISQMTSMEMIYKDRIGVFGEKNLAIFDTLKLPWQQFDTWEQLSEEGIKVAIIMPDAITPTSSIAGNILAFLKRGGRVILLEQKLSLFPTVVLEEKQVMAVHLRAYDHPVLDNIKDSELAFFGEDSYALLAGDSYVADRMYHKDDGRNMLVLMDAGDGSFGDGGLSYTPLFEIKEGKGLLLACQLKLADKLDKEPVAALLLKNMLMYASSYKQVPDKEPLILTEYLEQDTINAVKRAKEGGTVLVMSLSEESVKWWNDRLNITMALKKTETVYQAVRVKNDAVLNGISNEDTCGIEVFSYSPSHKKNYPAGDTFLVPDKKMEVLLETPAESALKELFELGGKSELLRAHTLSRFLFKEKPDTAAVLASIRKGKGIIYFLCADNRYGSLQFQRFFNRLLANMGVNYHESLLKEDYIPAALKNSDGFPEKIQVLSREVSGEEFKKMIECTLPSMERMATSPILNVSGFKEKKGDQGSFKLDKTEQYIYYRIYTPVARKNMATNLGVPNPLMLTFLDLYGSGKAEVYVNGLPYGELEVEGQVTVSDISLEKDFNHILIKWGTNEEKRPLKMQFRNMMRQAESSFRFL